MPRPSSLTVLTGLVVLLNLVLFGHGFKRLTQPFMRATVPYFDLGSGGPPPANARAALALMLQVKGVGGFDWHLRVPPEYAAVPGGVSLGLLLIVLLVQLGRGVRFATSPAARRRSALDAVARAEQSRKWLKVVELGRRTELRYAGHFDEHELARLKLSIGRALAGLGNLELALAEFREVLGLDPTSFEAIGGVATALAGSDADVPDEWLEPALSYLRRREPAEPAMVHYFVRDLVKKAKYDRRSIDAIDSQLHQLRNREELVKLVNDSLTVLAANEPELAQRALLVKARTLLSRKEPAAALDELRKAAALDSDQDVVHELLWQGFQDQGDVKSLNGFYRSMEGELRASPALVRAIDKLRRLMGREYVEIKPGAASPTSPDEGTATPPEAPASEAPAVKLTAPATLPAASPTAAAIQRMVAEQKGPAPFKDPTPSRPRIRGLSAPASPPPASTTPASPPPASPPPASPPPEPASAPDIEEHIVTQMTPPAASLETKRAVAPVSVQAPSLAKRPSGPVNPPPPAPPAALPAGAPAAPASAAPPAPRAAAPAAAPTFDSALMLLSSGKPDAAIARLRYVRQAGTAPAGRVAIYIAAALLALKQMDAARLEIDALGPLECREDDLYMLGTRCEVLGLAEVALAQYRRIAARKKGFLDVEKRLDALEKKLAPPTVAAETNAPSNEAAPPAVAPSGTAASVGAPPPASAPAPGAASIAAPGEADAPRDPETSLTGKEETLAAWIPQRYEKPELVGRGGMGAVFRARDTELDRVVAIKLLSPHLAGNEESEQRFLTEARTLANLKHPGLIEIYDIHRANVPFIAMEFLEGQNMGDMLRSRALTLGRALKVLAQVVSTLAYCHKSGVLHRDIKPENIVVSPSGMTKLVDFGLARRGGGAGQTQQGTLIGSPLYMSPEAFRGGKIDGRADLYSIGVCLYYVCTGKHPFRDEADHLNGTLKPIRQLNPQLPASLEAAVNRCLARNPSERYASAEALGQDLAPFVRPPPAKA